MTERRRRLVGFGEGVRDLLASLGVPNVEIVLDLQTRWSEIVGEPWASSSHPVVIQGSELTVEAQTRAAASVLRYATGDLLRTLDEVYGEGMIQSVKITVGS